MKKFRFGVTIYTRIEVKEKDKNRAAEQARTNGWDYIMPAIEGNTNFKVYDIEVIDLDK